MEPWFDVRLDQDMSNGGRLTYSAGYSGTTGIIHTGIGPFVLGLEHFGFDSEHLETDIARLEKLGAKLLEGPIQNPGGALRTFARLAVAGRLNLAGSLIGLLGRTRPT